MNEVKYTATHEWIEVTNNEGVVGITERVQLIYGDIIFVDLPPVNEEFEQDDVIGRVEVADGDSFPIHAPITGEIRTVNAALEDDPDIINRSPEGDGWICKMSVESSKELDVLMDAKEYDSYEEEEPDEDLLSETDFYDNEDDY
ncbi:MAG: glycine cleavage system protein H [Candidatus Poribacteria bacterium]|nr:glycine cleavage system protein H [Candidatus Poribacteria bacterium]